MNYYNEFDPKAAAWLQELINEGLIPNGNIDTRSITDVQPADLEGFVQCHFFAGIGGWPYALKLAGWPETRPVWTGSCPCQPFSCAGKQLGERDERHLWPAFFRLIRECRPECVFGEQVAGAIGKGWLDGICADLEAENYAVGACVLGAHSVGAPHIRQRLYWVANASSVPWAQHEQESRKGLRRGPEPHDSSERGGDNGGMSYAEHNGRRADEPGRGSPGRTANGRDSEACGLANTEPGGLGPNGNSAARRGESVSGSEQRRMADTARGGLGTDGSAPGHAGHAELGEQDRGMGDMQQPGLEGRAGNGNKSEKPGRLGADAVGSIAETGAISFWSSAIWHQCRDGKARRISPEPALFPLSYGLPGRVGLLRGAGNAIVPQVAAAFIQAFCEATETESTVLK